MVPFSPYGIYYEEITVLGSMAVHNSYGPALKLVAEGHVNVRRLPTHEMPLASYPDAFETLRGGDELKIQVIPQPQRRP
jgi:threonine dehydrogenase-like Zn-dependent dehydrogenase